MTHPVSPADHLRDRGYLTINGFVEYLKLCYPLYGVSYPTAKRYVERGRLQAVIVGGQTRIPAMEICKFVNSCVNPAEMIRGQEEGAEMPPLRPIVGFDPADTANHIMQEW